MYNPHCRSNLIRIHGLQLLVLLQRGWNNPPFLKEWIDIFKKGQKRGRKFYVLVGGGGGGGGIKKK